MNTSPEIDQISVAIVAAQAEFGAVAKSAQHKHQGYRYATLNDHLDVVLPVLANHDLSILTETGGYQYQRRETRGGNQENGAVVCVNTIILHSSGQWILVAGMGEGQDGGDKGVAQAISSGRKHALAAVFGLRTEDESTPATAPPNLAYDFYKLDGPRLLARLQKALAGEFDITDWKGFCNAVAARAALVTKQGTPERTEIKELLDKARAEHCGKAD